MKCSLNSLIGKEPRKEFRDSGWNRHGILTASLEPCQVAMHRCRFLALFVTVFYFKKYIWIKMQSHHFPHALSFLQSLPGFLPGSLSDWSASLLRGRLSAPLDNTACSAPLCLHWQPLMRITRTLLISMPTCCLETESLKIFSSWVYLFVLIFLSER